MTNIFISSGVTNIGNSVFNACYELTAITVATNNTAYSSSDGVLFNANRTLLIQYPLGKVGGYRIPDSVNSIGYYAFANCSYLYSIVIPEGVTNIESETFSESSDLTNIYFLGDSPENTNDVSVFLGDDNAMIYYLAGTTGWGSIFDGLPAALWAPRAESSVGFGVRNNQFGFTISGPTNAIIIVQACTNLVNPVWLPVSTNFLDANGQSTFGDTEWTSFPKRYYRLGSP